MRFFLICTKLELQAGNKYIVYVVLQLLGETGHNRGIGRRFGGHEYQCLLLSLRNQARERATRTGKSVT